MDAPEQDDSSAAKTQPWEISMPPGAFAAAVQQEPDVAGNPGLLAKALLSSYSAEPKMAGKAVVHMITEFILDLAEVSQLVYTLKSSNSEEASTMAGEIFLATARSLDSKQKSELLKAAWEMDPQFLLQFLTTIGAPNLNSYISALRTETRYVTIAEIIIASDPAERAKIVLHLARAFDNGTIKILNEIQKLDDAVLSELMVKMASEYLLDVSLIFDGYLRSSQYENAATLLVDLDRDTAKAIWATVFYDPATQQSEKTFTAMKKALYDRDPEAAEDIIGPSTPDEDDEDS